MGVRVVEGVSGSGSGGPVTDRVAEDASDGSCLAGNLRICGEVPFLSPHLTSPLFIYSHPLILVVIPERWPTSSEHTSTSLFLPTPFPSLPFPSLPNPDRTQTLTRSTIDSALLQRRPMATQCVTGAVLFGAGDVIAQQAIEKQDGRKYDVRWSSIRVSVLFRAHTTSPR